VGRFGEAARSRSWLAPPIAGPFGRRPLAEPLNGPGRDNVGARRPHPHQHNFQIPRADHHSDASAKGRQVANFDTAPHGRISGVSLGRNRLRNRH